MKRLIGGLRPVIKGVVSGSAIAVAGCAGITAYDSVQTYRHRAPHPTSMRLREEALQGAYLGASMGAVVTVIPLTIASMITYRATKQHKRSWFA